MKKILVMVLVALSMMFSGQNSAQAQDVQKEILLIDNFTYPRTLHSDYVGLVKAIRSKVIAKIVSTGKVQVIDLSSVELQEELYNSSTSEMALESAMNDAEFIKRASKQYAAKYVLQGTVSHMDAKRNRLDDGTVYYTGAMGVNISIHNLEDGTVLFSRDYNYSGITGRTGDTHIVAVERTADYLAAAMPKMISIAFKLTGDIVKIRERNKSGDAKVVSINLGKAAGVKKGDKFNVFRLDEENGDVTREEVGLIKVTDVIGDKTSICKVTKGGALITTSFDYPDEVVLKVESADRRIFWDQVGDSVSL